jgi:hypothetical protein
MQPQSVYSKQDKSNFVDTVSNIQGYHDSKKIVMLPRSKKDFCITDYTFVIEQ